MGPRSEIPIPEIPYHEMVLGMVWQHHCNNPHRAAFVLAENDQEYVTFGEVYTVVHSLANFLEEIGFGKGDIAMICLPNSWHYAAMFLAVSIRGGATTGLSDQHTTYETQHQLKDSTSSIVLTTSTNLNKILTVSKECSKLKTIILLDDDIPYTLNTCLRIVTWKNAISKEPIYIRCKIKIDVHNDMISLSYSSGTTGIPKGVMITHYNYVANHLMAEAHAVKYVSPYLYEDTPDILLAILKDPGYTIGYLPFYHAYGFTGLCTNLMRGSTMVVMKKYTPELLFRNLEKYKIKSIFMIPELINFMLKSHLIDKYDLSSLRAISNGAGPLDQRTADAVKHRFPHIKYVLQAYGMTEMTAATHFSNLGNKKHLAGAVGIPFPNVECKIVNSETGEICKLGEPGEILVRGPNMMKGYWNNIKATREIIDKDGWLHTGDIGNEDDEGNLYIHDRIKELIKVKSFQVPPAELEAIILTHPEVQDVAVVGIPDEIFGEVPRAFVVKRSDRITVENILQFVKERVSHYKELKGGVEFINEVPRNPSGKILRRYLKEAFANRKRDRIVSKI